MRNWNDPFQKMHTLEVEHHFICGECSQPIYAKLSSMNCTYSNSPTPGITWVIDPHTCPKGEENE